MNLLTKPLTHLRIPMDIKKVLFSDVLLHHVNGVLRPASIRSEADDIRYFYKTYSQLKHDTSTHVINLCKHWDRFPSKDVSRVYNEDLSFKTFRNLQDILKGIPDYASNIYIFDEDVGGGYLVSFLENYAKLLKGVSSVRVFAPIFFDPEKEEVLDLKDLLCKYSDSAGIFINTSRVWYFDEPKIASKFASVREEHYTSLAIFFGILSVHVYQSLGSSYIAGIVLDKLESLGWTEAVPEFSDKASFNEYLKNVRSTLWNSTSDKK